ncbi:MAG: methionyl-tRNA formyltransferase [Ignavibacteriae bacterium]|nr:methionyl-tRNA formyltransferase [Ignavibacteria bacterium]MBI3364425.1 methionyl-tRNA formyltransferase [Ignavibacteriota bacterium]
MRIVFMGTPEFAIPSLNILVENRYQIAAVVTVPDKPAGRGQVMTPSPVKEFALAHRLAVLQPEQLKDPAFIMQLRTLAPDLFIVVAFRILPFEVFMIPRCGAFNLHASLLPKYRGAAPINWAIINGEKETGVTTFLLQQSVDTGGVILQARVPINEDETAGELHDRLAEVGAEIVLHTVRLIETGKASPKPQDNLLAIPAPKIFKEHCRVDWTKSAAEVHNFIRGLSPRPAAFTCYDATFLKLYRSRRAVAHGNGSPGEIVCADTKLIVNTGDGAIEIVELQQEGKRRLPAAEFLRGYPLQLGKKFQ